VIGEGPVDVVFVPPHVSNVELVWDIPPRAEGMRRVAEFARLITFDKRGTGLSDRVAGIPPLEERMDDVRAVMDATGSSRASLFGVREGGPMSLLFAATYPDRCAGLVLFDTCARATWAPDYPRAPTEAEIEREVREVERSRGSQASRLVWILWSGLDPEAHAERVSTIARFHRQSASPGAAAALTRMNAEIDIRGILSAVRVPALVCSTASQEDRVRRDAAYLAEHLPAGRLVELEDHGSALFSGDLDRRIDVLRSFVIEAAAREAAMEEEAVLATVLFTDIVDSTARAVELGDHGWRELVAEHHRRVRAELSRFRASFDGPARAIRCACTIRDAVEALGVEIRAGIHSGECVQVDGKVAGIAVVTGARIAALAGPGEVLVSATVRDLVAGSEIEFEDRGSFALKGIAEERQVFAVAQA
jgi:class 3 adenylate cyclase